MIAENAGRSPLLMNRSDTALLVIDVQERLVPSIDGREALVRRCEFLARSAQILNVPIIATEQYAKGLGHTVEPLAPLIGPPIDKLTFSSCGAPVVLDRLAAARASKVLLCGIEAHVCVQQTALDLLAVGFCVYIAADAVGSRGPIDKQVALDRIARAGAIITTAEAAAFEWLQTAGTPEFKQVQELIKQTSNS